MPVSSVQQLHFLTVYSVHRKKVSCFPVPSRNVTNKTLTGIIKLFLARDSLDSDTQAWNGKTANLFLQNTCFLILQRRVSFDFTRKFRKVRVSYSILTALANKRHVYEELQEDYFPR
jgi:hypothetical protein